MFVVIEDDNGNVVAEQLKGYQIAFAEKEEALQLTLDMQTKTIKYRIVADDRWGNDISLVKDYVERRLEEAIEGHKPFSITEYLERVYIYIWEDKYNGKCGQFTAQRL